MAHLKGPIQFTGSVGNIKSVYNKTLKRYILSTKGGPSAALIKNSPAFARTRENMSEFKACGQSSSQLRKSLLLLSHLFDGLYFSEIVKLAKEIQIHDDENPKGFRAIEPSKIPQLLTQLNFNREHPFNHVFSERPTIVLSEDKKTVELSLPGFKASKRIHWRTRFSSFRLALVIAQMPDFVYSTADAGYVPVIRDMEQLSVVAWTQWLPNTADPRDILLSASFTDPALQQPGTTVVVAIGIEISSTLLKPGDSYSSPFGTMKIVECFV